MALRRERRTEVERHSGFADAALLVRYRYNHYTANGNQGLRLKASDREGYRPLKVNGFALNNTATDDDESSRNLAPAPKRRMASLRIEGSHHHFEPTKPGLVTVAYDQEGDDIGGGTLNSIFKQAGGKR